MKFEFVRFSDFGWCGGADFFAIQVWRIVLTVKLPYRWRISKMWINSGLLLLGWLLAGVVKVPSRAGSSDWKAELLEILKGPF
jgi:hypothetical protein